MPAPDAPVLSEADKLTYTSILRDLRYLANCTPPDIAFATSRLARQMREPTIQHLQKVKDTLRYLKGTPDHSILYPTEQDNLQLKR